MTNHSTQLDLFNIRIKIFRTVFSKRGMNQDGTHRILRSASAKFNEYIYAHNEAHRTSFSVEPVDVKPNQDATVITLVYIPHAQPTDGKVVAR